MSTLAAAQTLQAQLRLLLGTHADLVTLDGAGIKPTTRGTVLIRPPEVTFPNWNMREAVWTIVLAAGPATQPVTAWERLDVLLDAILATDLPVAKAIPAQLDLGGTVQLPAFELTLHPHDID